jgi:hypothetical protein
MNSLATDGWWNIHSLKEGKHRMEVTYVLSQKEYLQILMKLSSGFGKYGIYASVLLGIAIAHVTGIGWYVTVLVGVLLLIFVFVVRKRELLKIGTQQGKMKKQTVQIGDDGITVLTETADASHKWNGITGVSQDQRYIYLYLNSVGRSKQAIVIPKRAFFDVQDRETFFSTALSFYEGNQQTK